MNSICIDLTLLAFGNIYFLFITIFIMYRMKRWIVMCTRPCALACLFSLLFAYAKYTKTVNGYDYDNIRICISVSLAHKSRWCYQEGGGFTFLYIFLVYFFCQKFKNTNNKCALAFKTLMHVNIHISINGWFSLVVYILFGFYRGINYKNITDSTKISHKINFPKDVTGIAGDPHKHF